MNSSDNDDGYNDVLLDKIMEWRSLANFSDSAIRYLCEADLNPGREEFYLQKAQVLANLEMARVLTLLHQYPPRSK